MTPKEKAIQLVERYGEDIKYAIDHKQVLTNTAKSCALIAVDETLSVICDEYNADMGSRDFDKYLLGTIDFYKSVRAEIEKL